jgi:hypothetical protein
MIVDMVSRCFAALLFLFLSHAWCTVAQTTNYNPYPTTAANSSPTDAAGENAAGASGAEGGSVNLSMGAIIAIVVVVAVVVLLGGMFFLLDLRARLILYSCKRNSLLCSQEEAVEGSTINPPHRKSCHDHGPAPNDT